MKKISNIILIIFLISLVTPTIQSLFKEKKTIESVCDIEKTEKEKDNSEEKELEKNEMELFDKILLSDKILFIPTFQLENEIYFHFLNNHNSQFKEIFSPPPEFS